MPTRPPGRPPDRVGSVGGTRVSGDSRAQTNVIGAVLLMAMVLTSASLIVISGSSVVYQIQEVTGQESTTNAVEEIDTALSSVASVGGLTRAEFTVGDASPSQYRVVEDGHVNVTVNRNASCRAHIPLSSIRYERDDGVVMGFEAGGVWRQEGGVISQTAMHTPPDLTYENGTVALTVINVSGQIRGSSSVISENVSRSIETNEEVKASLFRDYCARPDNVTISVTSDFYHGWSGYMAGSLDGTRVDRFDNNDTARIYYDQGKLPEEVNDSRNDVVDLNSSEFNDIKITNTSVKVNKSANNTYTAIVTPLSSGSTQVGEIRTVEADSAYRPPLDVVFVVDESGSMSNDNRMYNAKIAAKNFVGRLNESVDRAGVVGFTRQTRIKVTGNGEYLTDDFGNPSGTADGINESINALATPGWTNMAAGISGSNVMLGLKSNSSRKKVVILLGDGRNEITSGYPQYCPDQPRCLDQRAIDQAEIASKDGVTIHTIALDTDTESANDTLRDIADISGGTYQYVEEPDDLDGVFQDLFAEISEAKQVVRHPLSMELEAGGTKFQPQVDGNTSHVATGQNEELNLNDPTAPSQFSYSIDVSDGENVSMRAVDYDCLEWERTEQIYENETTGQEYAEVRCVEVDDGSRELVEPSSTDVYVDGNNVSSLLAQPSNWWNEDLQNETLEPYLTGSNNDTLDLESNQAIIVYEFEDDDGAADRMIALYRIGQARETTVPKYVFNIEVRHLEVGEES